MIDEKETKYEIRPLYIILSGSCKIICPIDSFEVIELKRGEVFGESDLLRVTVSNFIWIIVYFYFLEL